MEKLVVCWCWSCWTTKTTLERVAQMYIHICIYNYFNKVYLHFPPSTYLHTNIRMHVMYRRMCLACKYAGKWNLTQIKRSAVATNQSKPQTDRQTNRHTSVGLRKFCPERRKKLDRRKVKSAKKIFYEEMLIE